VETTLAILVGLLFGAHWLLTLVCQLPVRRFTELVGRDRFGLIPRWNFFAPTPGNTDYHCLVRAHFAGGTTSTWEELRFAPAERAGAAFLWNPDKRAPKALFDAVSILFRAAKSSRDPERTVPFSVPYLALLTAASARIASPFATGVQFMLMRSIGGQSPEVLFVSNVHDA
jgi:hypothetical protein